MNAPRACMRRFLEEVRRKANRWTARRWHLGKRWHTATGRSAARPGAVNLGTKRMNQTYTPSTRSSSGLADAHAGEALPEFPPAEAAITPDDRFELDGRSLRGHTARGVIVNSMFDVVLAAVGLIQRFAVAAFLTASEFGVWGLVLVTLLTLAGLKQIGISDKYVQQDEPDQELAFQKAFTLELAYTLIFCVFLIVVLPLYA